MPNLNFAGAFLYYQNPVHLSPITWEIRDNAYSTRKLQKKLNKTENCRFREHRRYVSQDTFLTISPNRKSSSRTN